MEPVEKMCHPVWNLLKSWANSDGIHTAAICIHAIFSIELPPDGFYRGDGPPLMESKLKSRKLPWVESASKEDIATVHL
jgi:hypothetical protein